MGRPTVTEDRFWERVRIGGINECWPWLGKPSDYRKGMGYARIDAFGVKGAYVHRVAHWLSNPAPLRVPLRWDGKTVIRHKCDNPLCCNPMHLDAGTHLDNMRDKVERGRQHTFVSIESPRAKLTADDVKAIRQEKVAPTMPRKQLAARYSVSLPTIKSVLSGRHYSDIP